jgi:hypothetical protein
MRLYFKAGREILSGRNLLQEGMGTWLNLKAR